MDDGRFDELLTLCDSDDGLSRQLPGDFSDVARFMSSAIVMRSNFGSSSFQELFENDIDPGVDHDAMQLLAARAERLSVSPGLRLYRKGVDIIFESERQLSSARILTDIRPVFEDGSDESAEPCDWRAVVLVHQLRMDVFKPGTNESDRLLVSMNRQDLERLHLSVQRELNKTAKIQEHLDLVGIKWIHDPVDNEHKEES
jgi:hypothetical protein